MERAVAPERTAALEKADATAFKRAVIKQLPWKGLQTYKGHRKGLQTYSIRGTGKDYRPTV